MTVFKKMYFELFNALSNAIEEIDKHNFGNAAEIIKTAQLSAEEIFIDEDNEEDPL